MWHSYFVLFPIGNNREESSILILCFRARQIEERHCRNHPLGLWLREQTLGLQTLKTSTHPKNILWIRTQILTFKKSGSSYMSKIKFSAILKAWNSSKHKIVSLKIGKKWNFDNFGKQCCNLFLTIVYNSLSNLTIFANISWKQNKLLISLANQILRFCLEGPHA